MKTERNGILETAWRKLKAFAINPLFDFLTSVGLLFVFACLVAAGMVEFPAVESISWFIAAGVVFGGFCGFFSNFMSFLSRYKPSAEADKTN